MMPAIPPRHCAAGAQHSSAARFPGASLAPAATAAGSCADGRLVCQARTRPARPPIHQRRLRPMQVALGYGVQAGNAVLQQATTVVTHAVTALGEGVAAGMGAGVGLLVGCSSPVESVKTVLEVQAGRRRARAARERVDHARTRLAAAAPAAEWLDLARHWLDRRHGLESWAATRRCCQAGEARLRHRLARWRTTLDRLRACPDPTPAMQARRQRLERRIEALEQLGPRRVARLRSSAVSVEKRLKEAVSGARQLGGVAAAAVGLALGVGTAGGSVGLVLLGTVFLPLVLPLLLLVDGVFGSVEANQLLRRARSGRAQQRREGQRMGAARRSLASALPGSPERLFLRGLTALQPMHRRQLHQWRRDVRMSWSKRLRSAAYVVLAPVLFGLAVASLVAVGATPVGWALLGLTLLVGCVGVLYGLTQAVLNRQQARSTEAFQQGQRDHAALAGRAPADWRRRADLLDDPVWADNAYLAIELMVRSLVQAARDPAARARLDAVFRHDLGFSRRWTGPLWCLAAHLPDDAPAHHEDVWRLCEALLRRFDLPVPKAGRRPSAV